MKTKGELIKVWRRYGVTVRLYDTGGRDDYGQAQLAYRLSSGSQVIFEGDDFGPSPLHAIDGVETVRGLLSFLTPQPGDTDDEYFKDYTQAQTDWAASAQADDIRSYLYQFND